MEKKMKEICEMDCNCYLKALGGILLVALIVFVGAKAKNEIKNQAKAVENVTQRTITVSAEGKILAKPDIGQITIAVTNEAKAVGEAQSQSTAAINKIVAFLRASKVDDKDIKTTSYNINPVYDYNKGRQILRGYQVSQNLEIKIRDLTKAGDIIAGAAENGANVISGLSFTIDNPESVKEQARQEAIKQAREKAEKLASNLGVRLGKLINYSESGEYPQPYYGAVLGMGEAKSIAPEIPTGENEITIDVMLTYELK